MTLNHKTEFDEMALRVCRGAPLARTSIDCAGVTSHDTMQGVTGCRRLD
ncbi:hypothetical protein [Paraburkholderia sabiae]